MSTSIEKLLQVPDQKPGKSLDNRFEEISTHLFKNMELVVGNTSYRLAELEFYFHSPNHPDPYVHRDDKQLHSGKWYFNGFGLDITFGNGIDIFGGILIRGIATPEIYPHYISGPSNVLKEIFSKIGSVTLNNASIKLRELNNETNNDGLVFTIDEGEYQLIENKPISSSRIGLTKKSDDIENYADKRYRFIVGINHQHKFKDKEKVVRQLLAENKITSEKAKEIMGYNINL